MSDEIKEFQARVYFLTTEESGRSQPFYSGYRPAIWLGGREGGEKRLWEALVVIEDGEPALPGEERQVRVRVWAPEIPWEALKPQMPFELSEAFRIIGQGAILKVCRESVDAKASVVS
jgi:elongation factor Tu